MMMDAGTERLTGLLKKLQADSRKLSKGERGKQVKEMIADYLDNGSGTNDFLCVVLPCLAVAGDECHKYLKELIPLDKRRNIFKSMTYSVDKNHEGVATLHNLLLCDLENSGMGAAA